MLLGGAVAVWIAKIGGIAYLIERICQVVGAVLATKQEVVK